MRGDRRRSLARASGGLALALGIAGLTGVAASSAHAAAGPLPGSVANLQLSGDLSAPMATWDAADGHGAPIVGYAINFDHVTSWVDADTTTRSIRAVGGLSYSDGVMAPGSHVLTVAALTAYGVGPDTEVSWTAPETTAISRPGAPTGLAVHVGSDGHRMLTWTAPADDGGSPLVDYKILVDTSQRRTLDTVPSQDVTDLDPGQHTVIVWAVNAKGQGDAAVVQLTFPASPVPSAVQTLATHDGLSPSVSWSAPVADGGSAVTGYQVRVDGGSWSDVGTATTYSLSSTSSPDQHKVEVAAVNANGAGVASTVMSVHYVPAVPNAPQISGVSNLGVVTWTPAEGLGNAISSYTLTVDGTTTFTAAGDATSLTLTGLAEGSHSVVVTATNSVGSGGDSAPWPWVQIVTPSAERNVRVVTNGQGDHWVAWEPPSDNGADTGVAVRILVDGVEQTYWPARAFQEPYQSFNLVGLSAQSHTVSVISTNIAGDGPAVVVPIDPSQWPVAPTPVTVTAGGLVRWPTGSGNGHPITGYDVWVDGSYVAQGLSATTRSYALSGLAVGAHLVAVQLRTAVASMVEAPMLYVQTGAPHLTSVKVVAGPGVGAVHVGWHRATDLATGYDVTIKRGATVVATRHVVDGPGADHADFTQLPHAKLTVSVRATSGAGPGPVVTKTVTPWVAVPTVEAVTAKLVTQRWHLSGHLTWGAGTYHGSLEGQRLSLYRHAGGALVLVTRATTRAHGAFTFPSMNVAHSTTYELRFAAKTIKGQRYAASSYVRTLR